MWMGATLWVTACGSCCAWL